MNETFSEFLARIASYAHADIRIIFHNLFL